MVLNISAAIQSSTLLWASRNIRESTQKCAVRTEEARHRRTNET